MSPSYPIDGPVHQGMITIGVQVTIGGDEPRTYDVVPGFCFDDQRLADFTKPIRPSLRGQFALTDINRCHLDPCTHGPLAESADCVMVVENRRGLK